MALEAQKYIWFDGEFLSWESAQTHLVTHTLHYGLGAFEGIRCYPTVDGGRAIFRCKSISVDCMVRVEFVKLT